MRIQAKWENGAFHPVQPLAIKHALVTIDVPDSEIEEISAQRQEVAATDNGSDLLDRFEQILAPHREQLTKGGAFTEQDYKKMHHEHLEEKYLGSA